MLRYTTDRARPGLVALYDIIIIIIIIIISGFGIYGAAVVPDSGVGNTWQRLTLVLHEFLARKRSGSILTTPEPALGISKVNNEA